MAAKMSELLQWRLEYQIQKVINISLAIIPKVMSLGSSQFYTVHKILSSVFHQVSENSDFADKRPH